MINDKEDVTHGFQLKILLKFNLIKLYIVYRYVSIKLIPQNCIRFYYTLRKKVILKQHLNSSELFKSKIITETERIRTSGDGTFT